MSAAKAHVRIPLADDAGFVELSVDIGQVETMKAADQQFIAELVRMLTGRLLATIEQPAIEAPVPLGPKVRNVVGHVPDVLNGLVRST